MTWLEQLREEAELADVDAEAAVFVFGTDALEVQMLEQRARAKEASVDALQAQAEVLAERHAGPRPHDPLAAWMPTVL